MTCDCGAETRYRECVVCYEARLYGREWWVNPDVSAKALLADWILGRLGYRRVFDMVVGVPATGWKL